MKWQSIMGLIIVGGFAVAGALVVLTMVISTTSALPSMPAPLPTATPLMVPTAPPRLTADPNTQVQAQMASGVISAATNLSYSDGAGASPGAVGAQCRSGGRWSVEVDPENMVGHPYPVPPSGQDWMRVVRAMRVAQSICSAPVLVSWVAHDPQRPAGDSWTVLLSADTAVNVDSPALQRYALRHGQQE